VIMALQSKSNPPDFSMTDIAITINFILNVEVDGHENDDTLGNKWSNELLSINALDRCDGKSVIHVLAEASALETGQMKTILDTCIKAGKIPNLSITTASGDFPIRIASANGNSDFLNYFGIFPPADSAPDKSNHNMKEFKASLLHILSVIDDCLNEAKTICKK
jgi:hypothetical protein